MFVCSHQLVDLWAASVNEANQLIRFLFFVLPFPQPTVCVISRVGQNVR